MREKLIELFNERLQTVYEMGQTFYYFKRNINPFLYDMGVILDDYPAVYEENFWDTNQKYDKNLSTKNLELIYDTYGSFYYGAQKFTSMINNIESRPYWQYNVVINPHTSALCKSLIDKVFSFDNPFWDKFYPPNHPGCMAGIRPLTGEQLENKNLQLSVGSDIIHPYPDWAFNPAKTNWKMFFNDFIIKTVGL